MSREKNDKMSKFIFDIDNLHQVNYDLNKNCCVLEIALKEAIYELAILGIGQNLDAEYFLDYAREYLETHLDYQCQYLK